MSPSTQTSSLTTPNDLVSLNNTTSTAGQKVIKTWDAMFDRQSGSQAHSYDPVILDLNGNDTADITGANVQGDNRIDGGVSGFDLNVADRQWQNVAWHIRIKPPAGSTAQVFDASGALLKTLDANQVGALQWGNGESNQAWNGTAAADLGLGLTAGQHVEFRDAKGTLVSQIVPVTEQMVLDTKTPGWTADTAKWIASSMPWAQQFGNTNKCEWTKAWDEKTGGDGMLVWDVDGDGKITSGKELFSNSDVNGKNVFANGYEKLAYYFDKNHDGSVSGDELKGLKIWEDRNGDGITDTGELVELDKYHIKQLSVQVNHADNSSTATAGDTWITRAGDRQYGDFFSYSPANDGTGRWINILDRLWERQYGGGATGSSSESAANAEQAANENKQETIGERMSRLMKSQYGR